MKKKRCIAVAGLIFLQSVSFFDCNAAFCVSLTQNGEKFYAEKDLPGYGLNIFVPGTNSK